MNSTRFNPRQTFIAALLGATFCTSASGWAKTVSWEDILNDDKTTGDVLSYGLGLKAQRHSTLNYGQHEKRRKSGAGLELLLRR
jgi:hypothetical protein